MINPVNKVASEAQTASIEKIKTKKIDENTVKTEGKLTLDPAVQLDIGSKPKPASAYGPKGTVQPDTKTIEALKKEAEDALAPLRQLVEELLTKQGKTFKDATLKPMEGEMVEITPEIRAEAQKQIGEDGAYNAENTSNRLVEFAKAISGGDKSKLDQLKDYIQKGYDEAEKAWGGELPDISKETLKLTMQKLDEWGSSTEA